MGRENHHKIPAITSEISKMIIMIMFKISAWGSANVHYLDKEVWGDMLLNVHDPSYVYQSLK